MNDARRAAVLLLVVAVGLAWACRRPARVTTTPTAPGGSGGDVVVLLPDSDSGTVGRAVVSNPSGAAELGAARESTRVSVNQPPAPATVMSEADVQRLFGGVLSDLPPAAEHFTLFFRFESNELTDESRAFLPQILQAVKARQFPDVLVVGHTDTTGSAVTNFALGVRRASAIRDLLVQAGLELTSIEVTSHGETDPLVRTADEVPEPRNRRVEVSIR